MALVILAISLLVACAAPSGSCVDVRGGGAPPNHVGALDVTLDVARRRAWVSSVELATLAEVDLDSGELRSVRAPDGGGAGLDRIAAAPDGRVWMWPVPDAPAGVYDPASDTYDTVTDAERVLDAVAFAGGMAVLAVVDGERVVQVRDVGGTLLRSAPAPAARGLATDGRELVAVGPTLTHFDATLAVLATYDVGFEADAGAILPEGAMVVAGTEAAAWIPAGGAPLEWVTGERQGDVVVVGDRALVLDRLGEPSVWGEALRVGPDGVEDRFVLGRNSAYGEVDPGTGLLWVNSEGTSEVRAYDATSGELVHATRLGTWLDGLAVDPDDPSVRFATGRLSQTVLRLDGGSVSASASPVDWPYSPVVDANRGVLWVLSETQPGVWALDLHTLQPVASLSLAPADYRLTFSTLTLDPPSDRLYAALAGVDQLVEIAAATLSVLRTWSLGGPALTDPEEIGELAVTVDTGTGGVFVSRSTDGRVQRVDPATGAVVTYLLTDGERALLTDARTVDRGRTEPSLGVYWYAGLAFDAASLTRLPTYDLPVAAVVDRWRGATDEWKAIDPTGDYLLRVALGGDVRRALAVAADGGAITRVRAAGADILLTRAASAEVCEVRDRLLE